MDSQKSCWEFKLSLLIILFLNLLFPYSSFSELVPLLSLFVLLRTFPPLSLAYSVVPFLHSSDQNKRYTLPLSLLSLFLSRTALAVLLSVFFLFLIFSCPPIWLEGVCGWLNLGRSTVAGEWVVGRWLRVCLFILFQSLCWGGRGSCSMRWGGGGSVWLGLFTGGYVVIFNQCRDGVVMRDSKKYQLCPKIVGLLNIRKPKKHRKSEIFLIGIGKGKKRSVSTERRP